MFKELEPLLRKGTTLTITLTGEGEQIRANIIPHRREGEDESLAQPLSLLATAEELDEGLPRTLQGFVETRSNLVEALVEYQRQADAVKASKQPKVESRATAKTDTKATTGGEDKSGNAKAAPADQQDAAKGAKSSRQETGAAAGAASKDGKSAPKPAGKANEGHKSEAKGASSAKSSGKNTGKGAAAAKKTPQPPMDDMFAAEASAAPAKRRAKS